MKVYIDATPEQIELIRKTGSKNRSEAFPALEAFASILSPVVQVVLDKMATVRGIYTVKNLSEFDVAEFPLDVFYDEKDGDIYVHFQSRPGGTPSSFLSDLQTVIVPTSNYVGEVSWQNKFARAGRLDVIASYVHKLGQAMLRKEELNGWAVLLRALAVASTNGLSHVVSSATTGGILYPELFNQLLTRAKRLNTSVDGGTAVAAPQGVTDIYLSPEAMQDIRSFSYNPVNIKGANNSTGDANSGVVALPDDMRRQILAGGGMPSLYGITLHEMNEFGIDQAYEKLWASFYGGTYTAGTDEIIVGLDQSRDSNVMPVKGGLTVTNDIFHSRSDKSGVIASEEVGFAVLDSRAVVGGIIEG